MERRGTDRTSEAARRRLEALARELGGGDAASHDLLDDGDDDALGDLWPDGMIPPEELPPPGAATLRRSRLGDATSEDVGGDAWGRHRSGAFAPLGRATTEATWLPSRRALSVLGDGVGPRHVGVALLVVLVAAAGVAWWVLRAQPQDVVAEPVAPVAEGGAAAPGTPGPAQTGQAGLPAPGSTTAGSTVPGSTAPVEVVVDVAGRVRRPGIVTLPTGSRVADAIKAAGGARRGADLTSVNLARVLVDGEQIVVGLPAVTGLPGAAPPGGGTGGSGTTASPGGLVNLNAATLEQLDTLPQVGPVTAQAIVDWRTEHGRFNAVEELLEVRGIGDATLARLRDLVTV